MRKAGEGVYANAECANMEAVAKAIQKWCKRNMKMI